MRHSQGSIDWHDRGASSAPSKFFPGAALAVAFPQSTNPTRLKSINTVGIHITSRSFLPNMLRRVARPFSAAVACQAAAAVRVASGVFAQSIRHMSEETHDDFKPKVKVDVNDKDEVQKTIEKVRQCSMRNMTCFVGESHSPAVFSAGQGPPYFPVYERHS